MAEDRLESLISFHPFTRLNKLLEGVDPGGGNTPLLLSLGEPQFDPPPFVAEIIAKAAAGWSKYPPTAGTEAFRAAVKAWCERRYALPPTLLDPAKNILPVSGTREALFQIALSAVAAGEAKGGEPKGKTLVLMGNPFYHSYAGAAVVAGGEPYFLSADRASGFLPSLAELTPEVLQRTAMVYLCSPANPQGAVADLSYLKDWLKLARQHDFLLAADECYAEIYQQAAPAGALQAARDLGGGLENLLVFHSLSKRSSAPGLRSGFVAGDARYIQRQAQLVNYGGVATPLPILAAATALWQDESHVEENRARYRRSFDLAQRILGPLFGEIRAEGGFFLWLEVGDGEKAAVELWRQAAIKVLPGGYMARPDAKGNNPGARYIRVALVYDPEQMEGALKRMARVLETLLSDGKARARAS